VNGSEAVTDGEAAAEEPDWIPDRVGMAAPVVEVPLMGTGDAVPEAAEEVPFEATLVAEAPA
jgi:hypothetical protein